MLIQFLLCLVDKLFQNEICVKHTNHCVFQWFASCFFSCLFVAPRVLLSVQNLVCSDLWICRITKEKKCFPLVIVVFCISLICFLCFPIWFFVPFFFTFRTPLLVQVPVSTMSRHDTVMTPWSPDCIETALQPTGWETSSSHEVKLWNPLRLLVSP